MALGGAKYFVSLIIDYFRRCWFYPIKKKSYVLSTFKMSKHRWDLNLEGRSVAWGQWNKYVDDEFLALWKRHGITRYFTVTYAPQKNGRTKWMNKTLAERMRVKLTTTCLHNSFWAEAAKTTCYVVNRSSSTTIKLKTLIEMWTDKPVDYSILILFGCPAYVIYSAQERTKLDPKLRRCIFLE